MIETSTHKTGSLREIQSESNLRAEDLGEEEQTFYTTIKPELNSIVYEPSKESIKKILDYSKSIQAH